MKLSDAWLEQSKSDLAASKRLLDEADRTTYCQTISKCQQAVEKAIKGLVTGLTETGIAKYDVGWKHEVGKFITTFRYPPKKGQPTTSADIMSSLREFFSNGDIESGIRQLDGVVPKRPADGDPLLRNTEYPFHAADRSFRAPAEPEIFTLQEVRRYSDIAERVYIRCVKTASALRLIKI
jgi:HEPN domain